MTKEEIKMAVGFYDMLRENDKKGLFSSDDTFVPYSSGLLPLDFANGFYRRLLVDADKDEWEQVPVVGILGGTFILVIGETGSGKTTFADQLGYSIIRKFQDGLLEHVDAEKTQLKDRLIQLCQADPNEYRIILNKKHTTTDDVIEQINKICDLKQSLGDQMKYTLKGAGMKGEDVKAYIPTVIIIDSLPSFFSKDHSVEDMGSNLDGARGAKDLSTFLNNVLDRCWEYNITIIGINHIRPKLTTDPYAQPPRGMMMLNSKTESLPRGSVSQYYAHTCIRIKANRSNMTTVADDGYRGFESTFSLAKTKTNFIGTSFSVAFVADHGFDEIWTLYLFARDNGLLLGRNPHIYVSGMEDTKFNRKDFKNLFTSNKDFRNRFMPVIIPYLEALLGSKESSEEERIEYGSIFDDADDAQYIQPVK